MWLFYAMPVLAVFFMGVVHASESLDKVKRNWNEYRCNPIYIPFAGFIRSDVTTETNFQYCMNLFGQSIMSSFTDVIMSLFKTLASSVTEMSGPLMDLRSIFSKIRNFMLSFAAQVFGKITNSVSSITYIVIKIRDILKRFLGEGYIAMFLTNTLIDSAISFVMLVVSIIKTFVYGLLAMSILLALFQPELLILALLIMSLLGASGFL